MILNDVHILSLPCGTYVKEWLVGGPSPAPVEFEELPVEVQDLRIFTDRFDGFHIIYLK